MDKEPKRVDLLRAGSSEEKDLSRADARKRVPSPRVSFLTPSRLINEQCRSQLMANILSGLNDAQRCAVTSPNPVLQVLAPPGSGKTKTLTARVAYLIAHNGYQPWNIIVCTFTNKAAREMKVRIRAFLGDDLEKKLILGTFHAIALRFLRSYGHHVGLTKGFGIADSNDTMSILKRITKRHKYTMEPGVARSRISKLKARSRAVVPFKGDELREFEAIYADYEDALSASNLLDYDDLLLRCAELLRDCRQCVSNIEAVLIDEFQDTNHVQYELMGLFSQHWNRITVVGDPDQSIYAFRSAEPKNVAMMQREFPKTHVVCLEENYRSSASILITALGVIEQDKGRPTKKVLPTHAVGEPPVLRHLPHPKAEGTWIVEELKRVKHLTGGLLTYADFAVLVRSGHQSQAIELALGKAGLPYRMVGGHKFFDRWEIKTLLAYLRVISAPHHNDAIISVINEPSRGVGDETVKKLVEEAEKRKITLWQLVQNVSQDRGRVETNVRKAQRKGIVEFFSIISKAKMKLEASNSGVVIAELLDFLIAKLAFREHIRKKYGEEDADSRFENIEELRLQAAQFCTQVDGLQMELEGTLPVLEGVEQQVDLGPEAMLSRFLANVALATDSQVAQAVDERTSSPQITISTMHGAKGLEWPVVFVASMFEGSMPHSRADDHDEERRLLYVAMTRAQALLYISCPARTAGGGESGQTTLSPFLSSRSVTNLLSSKGPAISFSTVQDLARILRRDCPSKRELLEVWKTADQREDNFWPLDGKDPDATTTSWEQLESSRGYEPYGPPQKRRRLIQAGPADRRATTFATQTVMLDSSSFSVASSTLPTSFVTASSCLKQFAEIAAAEDTGAKASRSAPKASKEQSRAAPSTGGQGSMLSYLKKKPIPLASVCGPQTEFDQHDSNQQVAIATDPPSIALPSGFRAASGDGLVVTNENSYPQHANPREGPLSTSHAPLTGFKAATTFHMTSVAQAAKAPGKRSLGVRRSFQPLVSDRANKPFKPLSRPR